MLSTPDARLATWVQGYILALRDILNDAADVDNMADLLAKVRQSLDEATATLTSLGVPVDADRYRDQ